MLLDEKKAFAKIFITILVMIVIVAVLPLLFSGCATTAAANVPNADVLCQNMCHEVMPEAIYSRSHCDPVSYRCSCVCSNVKTDTPVFEAKR
jgi:hypothetical protein